MINVGDKYKNIYWGFVMGVTSVDDKTVKVVVTEDPGEPELVGHEGSYTRANFDTFIENGRCVKVEQIT